jgi:hypothetical protein
MSEIQVQEHVIQRIERQAMKWSGKQLAHFRADQRGPATVGDHEDPFKSRIAARWLGGSLRPPNSHDAQFRPRLIRAESL